MKAADGLPIGALSKESGVNIETIRYYERIGVMPEPARSAGGYRIYGPDHLKRLTFVRRGRELGFSLDELRDLLRLVDGHAYTCAEVHELAVEHVAAIRRRIADLRRLQRVMDEMAAQCSGNRIPECPIIDALFDARPKVAGLSRSPRAHHHGSVPHERTSHLSDIPRQHPAESVHTLIECAGGGSISPSSAPTSIL